MILPICFRIVGRNRRRATSAMNINSLNPANFRLHPYTYKTNNIHHIEAIAAVAVSCVFLYLHPVIFFFFFFLCFFLFLLGKHQFASNVVLNVQHTTHKSSPYLIENYSILPLQSTRKSVLHELCCVCIVPFCHPKLRAKIPNRIYLTDILFLFRTHAHKHTAPQ